MQRETEGSVKLRVGRPPEDISLQDRLDSWKAIASYLGRDVRTVQRWENEERLPVWRHSHLKGSSVHASKREIDEWRKSRSLAFNQASEPESDLDLLRTNGQLNRAVLGTSLRPHQRNRHL